MRRKRVFVYVQHLLGIGHLKRCVLLADAMTQAGLEVTLVSGGAPVAGITSLADHFVQLPAASAADLSFQSLVDAQGNVVDDAWKQQRRDLLLEAWRAADPHAIVIELFPFGRRQMRFELLPLLDAASTAASRPVIVSSVRDVLGGGQKDPSRQQGMLELFERYFDHLLVHGDPALVPFDRTFVHAPRIAGRLHYTGYVVDQATATPVQSSDAAQEVLVSVGGGAVGRQLLEVAIRARPLSGLATQRWRLLAGPNISESELETLRLLAADSGGGIVLERNRPDFTQLLAQCRVSVSQGGYNTVMDILQAGARSVVVPFAGGGEIEQSLRARLLAERGWLVVVEEAELSPVILADAIDRAALTAPFFRAAVNLDGARNSAELLVRWTSELR